MFTSSEQTERMDPAGPFPDADSLLQAFSYKKLMVPGITFVIIITVSKQLKNPMCSLSNRKTCALIIPCKGKISLYLLFDK